jgi:hypothetical protein
MQHNTNMTRMVRSALATKIAVSAAQYVVETSGQPRLANGQFTTTNNVWVAASIAVNSGIIFA